MKATYTLVCHRCRVERTTWWKDENRVEECSVWRTYGPGLGAEGRPSTDVEIELWRMMYP